MLVIDLDQYNAETLLMGIRRKTSLMEGNRLATSNDALREIKEQQELYHVIIFDIKSVISNKVRIYLYN